MGRPKIEITGNIYGKLTVIAHSHYNWWDCICNCGTKIKVQSYKLRTNTKTHCGCNNKPYNIKTHNKSRTITYKSWSSMKHRCLNKDSVDFIYYGEKGITICPTWINSFERFYKDMGERPSTLYSLERKNNNGNYNKDNCRWATRKEQTKNRSNTLYIQYKGKSKTLIEWCEIQSLNYNKVYKKINQGKTLDYIIKKHLCYA